MNQRFIEQQKDRLIRRRTKYLQIVNDKNYPEYYRLQKSNIGLVFISEALQKIEDGTYGICKDCHQEIPIERLKAVPGALRCVKCEERGGVVYNANH